MNKNVKIIIIGVIIAVVAVFSAVYVIQRFSHNNNHAKDGSAVKYHCPMHPSYISDKLGSCPICGMTLVPMEPSTGTSNTSEVSGQSVVTLTPEQERMVNLKTVPAKYRRIALTLRATGKVAHDTELYNAIIEYQNSLKDYDNLKKTTVGGDTIKSMESMIESGKLKLKHMGLSDAQVDNIKKDTPYPTNLIMSSEMTHNENTNVWVYLQIYEYDAGKVKEGQRVAVEAVALPGEKFDGTIKSVDRYLDDKTRTLRVRAEVNDTTDALKPEMFVNADIYVDLGTKLAVPEDCVVDSGRRKIVFIKLSSGKYAPKEVITGNNADGYYEIISGINSGDEVVASANFLLDSESKLNSAINAAQ
ncbi:MAG: efflux RND transporter periplasmic adaptor subunit [Elusimicrobiota bacterium]